MTGIDPEAPQGTPTVRLSSSSDIPGPVDAIVACTSLHHVADLPQVLDLAHATLAPGGVLVVVEWARERFDEATVRAATATTGPVAVILDDHHRGMTMQDLRQIRGAPRVPGSIGVSA